MTNHEDRSASRLSAPTTRRSIISQVVGAGITTGAALIGTIGPAVAEDSAIPYFFTATPAMDQEALRKLAAQIDGEIVTPDDATYDGARAVWNAIADRRPALIVYAVDAADVSASVSFARWHGLKLAVRSGGHSIVGHSVVDDGLVIDLSRMKRIDVDPEQLTARIEPGLTWGEVATALHASGLALTSGDTASVAVGGLTLGGGIGWMARKYGLTIDRLRSVDLITADGRFVRASADENPDLFWGLRGGGGNFGVAVSFTFSVHPGGTVLGGTVFYDASDPVAATAILRAYARIASVAPNDLTTQATFVTAPPAPFIPAGNQGKPSIAIAMCYSGDLAKGERVIASLRQLTTPIADLVAPMPYPAIFALGEIGEVHGWHHHASSLFIRTLNDDVLRTIATLAARIASPETAVQLRVLGGAIGRVPGDATAYAHRDAGAMVTALSFGPGAERDPIRRQRIEQFEQALAPVSVGVYSNFLGDNSSDRIGDVFPPATYERLAAVKRRYDPDNQFRHNPNILPLND